MRLRLPLVLLLLSLYPLALWSQSVPVYSVPSPEASGLGMYGSVPVSHFTGVPEISVPLHEARFGKYTIAITADYHLASVRPNDPPGCLGLGWSLKADGVIIRSVRGVCDEKRGAEAPTGNGCYWHRDMLRELGENPGSFDVLTRDHLWSDEGGSEDWYELSADEFSFSFLGYSGNFYLDTQGGWTVVCDQDVKVEFDSSRGFASCADIAGRIPGIMEWPCRGRCDCFFREFTLVTPDGLRCTFGGVDAMDFSIPYYGRKDCDIVATAWHLKRIETPEGYEVRYSYLSSMEEESIMVDVRYVPGRSSLEAPQFFADTEYLVSDLRGRLGYTGFLLYSVNLSSIVTPNESIFFEYLHDTGYGHTYAQDGREALYWDASGADGLYQTGPYSPLSVDPAMQFHLLFPPIEGGSAQEKRESIGAALRCPYLYRMGIKNLLGGGDRSLFFSYVTSNRRKVERMAWREGAGPVEPEYISGGGMMIPVYDIPENTSGTDMPEYHFGYDEGTFPRDRVFPRTDRWGYYSGSSWSSSDLWPGPGDSAVITTASQCETLREVTYPTGGRSVFEYENHSYSAAIPYPGSAPEERHGIAGGLRVRAISSFDRTDSLQVRTVYRYTVSPESNVSSGILSPDYPYTVTYSSHADADGVSVPLRLTLSYEAGFPPSVTRMNTPAVGYSAVIEERVDANGRPCGSTVYRYSNYDRDVFGDSHPDDAPLRTFNVGSVPEPGYPYTSRAEERGKLQRMNFQSADGTLVRREDTHYSVVNPGSMLTATQRQVVFCADPRNVTVAAVGWLTGTHTGSYLPTRTEVTLYDGPSPVTAVAETEYNAHRLPTLSRRLLVDDRWRERSVNYASDCPGYGWLADAHIVSLPESMTTSLDGESVTVRQEIVNASPDGSGAVPYTSKVEISTSRHPSPWTVYEVLSTDVRGNPSEIVEKGRHSVLGWSNQGQTLALRIDGVTLDECLSADMPAPAADIPHDQTDLAYPDEPCAIPVPDGSMATRLWYHGTLLLGREMFPDGVETRYDHDAFGRLKEVYYMTRGRRGVMERRTVRLYGYHLLHHEAPVVPDDSAFSDEDGVEEPAGGRAPRASVTEDGEVPDLDTPRWCILRRGHATEVDLRWNTQAPNTAYASSVRFTVTDTLDVNFCLPRITCTRGPVGTLPQGANRVLARLWRGDDDSREAVCDLPFLYDAANRNCRFSDGLNSLVLSLPPDTYVLEYRGMSSDPLVLPGDDDAAEEDEEDDAATSEGEADDGGWMLSRMSEGEPEGSSMTMVLECIPLTVDVVEPATTWNCVSEKVSRDGGSADVMETRRYVDDLGREQSTYRVGAGSFGRTLMDLREYDPWGRQTRTWLPAVSYPSAHRTPEDISRLSASANGDSAPYSSLTYEASPLDCVVESFGPSGDWHGRGKSVRTSYLSNSTDDPALRCLELSVTPTSSDSTLSCTVIVRGVAAPGSLSAVRTEDEDARVTIVFTDRLGRTVLSRRVLPASAENARETLLDTYYLYDGMDRVTAVIPPALSAGLSEGSSAADTAGRYAYLHIYDSRGRVSLRKIPGADWTRIVHDGADRVLYEQDGRLRRQGRAICHLYDTHGRECVTILCTRMLQDGESTDSIPTVAYTCAGGRFGGYDFVSDAETLTDVQVLCVNYYDCYSFATDFETGLPRSASDDANPSPVGRQTGKWCAGLSGGVPDGSSMWSSMHYDSRGRLVHTERSWGAGGTDTEDLSYDFLGSPVTRRAVHRHHADAAPITEEETFSYDHWERLLLRAHSLDGGTPVVLKNNTYDALGRLGEVSRGESTLLTERRGYDVRSRLTSIASPLFTQRLHYNVARADSSVPRYGGAVSGMEWKAGGDRAFRAYDFGYDGLGRLTDASYSTVSQFVTGTDDYSTSCSYDLQGNLLAMERQCTGDVGIRCLDRLTLNYDGNRLISAEDSGEGAAAGVMDFVDGAHRQLEYSYDACGSMILDRNRGLTLSYDINGHPAELQKGGIYVKYSYLASGEKTGMAVRSGSDSTVTEYRGNLMWRDGDLAYLLTDGGYVDCRATGRPYVFYLRDHLGNKRVAATARGTIVQVNHYYPYGASYSSNAQAGPVPQVPLPEEDSVDDGVEESTEDEAAWNAEAVTGVALPRQDQPWRFGGKELMDEAGTWLYDFEARLYDPLLGRFLQIDPMADKYPCISPYAYCAGDPVNYVDPDGKSWYYSDTDGAFFYHVEDTDDNIYLLSLLQIQNAQKHQKKNKWFVKVLQSYRSDDNKLGQMAIEDNLTSGVAQGVFSDLYKRANRNEALGNTDFVSCPVIIIVDLEHFGRNAESTSDRITVFAKEVGFKGYDIISTFAHEIGHILDRQNGSLPKQIDKINRPKYEKSADDFAKSHWSFERISENKKKEYEQHAKENGF